MSKVVEALVITGAAGVFVAGSVIGLNLALASPDTSAAAEPTCDLKRIAPGEELTSNLVMVHVYNAGGREGLANRVKINLERRDFLGGVAKNNPGQVATDNVTVLTSDPGDPRVTLVAQQFKGKVATAAPDFELEDGVSILVGRDYAGLDKEAANRIVVDREVTVCVPSVTLP